MSAQPSALRISTPSGLVAACPHLLGFTPEPGHLVAFITGVPRRLAPVTVRADLADLVPGSAVVADLAASMANTGGRQVDLVCIVGADDDWEREELPTAALVRDLAGCLIDVGLGVGLAVTTNGSVWWSHECAGSCCPDHATALDLAEMDAVSAAFIYAGMAPAASRAALRVRLEADPERVDRVAALLANGAVPTRRSGRKAAQTWRDVQIERLAALVLGSGRPGLRPASDEDVAALLMGLSDVRVRDTLVHRIARAPLAALPDAVAALTEALRAAPPGYVPAVATVLALAAWTRGEGALANVALDRADIDDPDYALADLTRRMMANGLDPLVWRQGIAGMPEEVCRTGGRA